MKITIKDKDGDSSRRIKEGGAVVVVAFDDNEVSNNLISFEIIDSTTIRVCSAPGRLALEPYTSNRIYVRRETGLGV